MENLSKLSLDALEVESFTSPTDLELSTIKGGTTPVVASSMPCVTAGAAVVTAIAAAYAAYNASNPPNYTTKTYPSGDTVIVDTQYYR